MNLPLIPIDKANHFMVGAAIALAAGFAFGREWGVLSAIAAGAAKECSDWMANRRAEARGEPPPHGVEFYDFIFTAGGAAVVYVAGAMP